MKPHMTAEEHRELGSDLKFLRDQIMRHHIYLAGKYGKTSKIARTAEKMYDNINQLRMELDHSMQLELLKEFNPNIYYGQE